MGSFLAQSPRNGHLRRYRGWVTGLRSLDETSLARPHRLVATSRTHLLDFGIAREYSDDFELLEGWRGWVSRHQLL